MLPWLRKGHLLLWDKPHLKWPEAKWESVLWSDESKFEILFGEYAQRIVRTNEKRDLGSLLSVLGSKVWLSSVHLTACTCVKAPCQFKHLFCPFMNELWIYEPVYILFVSSCLVTSCHLFPNALLCSSSLPVWFRAELFYTVWSIRTNALWLCNY